MRKILILVLLVVLVFAVTMSLPAKASVYCKHARHNPTYAIICFWEIVMDLWNPLDWGDNDDITDGSALVEENEFYVIKDLNILKHSRIPRAC